MDPHKVQVFASMRKPRTGKEVQRVLGIFEFSQGFHPSLCKYCGAVEEV